MDDLAGRVALVTGGASGIGFAIAQALVRQGMKVALADIDATAVADAASRLAHEGGAGTSVAGLPLDVSDAAAWNSVVRGVEDDFGPIAVMCNNAGIGLPGAAVEDIDPADWKRVLSVNLDGVYLGTRAIVPGMKQRGFGHIVNTSSILGLFPRAHNSAYVASKFAVVGFTEALRAELAPHGIGVSVLLPGLVQTAQMASAEKRHGDKAVVDSKAKPTGISADVVGSVVLDAIQNDRLYALSHSAYASVVADRAERLARAFASTRANGLAEEIDYLGSDSLALTRAKVSEL